MAAEARLFRAAVCSLTSPSAHPCDVSDMLSDARAEGDADAEADAVGDADAAEGEMAE